MEVGYNVATMATSSNTKVQKIGSLLRNPTVQRLLAWILPIVFGWILSKLDRSAANKNKK